MKRKTTGEKGRVSKGQFTKLDLYRAMLADLPLLSRVRKQAFKTSFREGRVLLGSEEDRITRCRNPPERDKKNNRVGKVGSVTSIRRAARVEREKGMFLHAKGDSRLG